MFQELFGGGPWGPPPPPRGGGGPGGPPRSQLFRPRPPPLDGPISGCGAAFDRPPPADGAIGPPPPPLGGAGGGPSPNSAIRDMYSASILFLSGGRLLSLKAAPENKVV